MNVKEKFLRYVQVETTSEDACENCPSSEGQMTLAKMLVAELQAMGVANAHVDEHGYVYGCLQGNAEGRPVIGLIAHMDTVDCVPALPMKARIVKDYDGEAVQLDNGDWLDPKLFPELKSAKGKDAYILVSEWLIR